MRPHRLLFSRMNSIYPAARSLDVSLLIRTSPVLCASIAKLPQRNQQRVIEHLKKEEEESQAAALPACKALQQDSKSRSRALETAILQVGSGRFIDLCHAESTRFVVQVFLGDQSIWPSSGDVDSSRNSARTATRSLNEASRRADRRPAL